MQLSERQSGKFAKILELFAKNKLPKDVCNAYMMNYKGFEEFGKYSYRHIHLENNILFPKSIELEKELTAK